MLYPVVVKTVSTLLFPFLFQSMAENRCLSTVYWVLLFNILLVYGRVHQGLEPTLVARGSTLELVWTKLSHHAATPKCATLCSLSLDPRWWGGQAGGCLRTEGPVFPILHYPLFLCKDCWRPHELFSSPDCDRTLTVAADGKKSVLSHG